ncbi:MULTISPECIES: hypothetical protein [Natrialba]|uniref:Uncharacterized protein n=1 Tax=Natrialba swarupiae TaxID=2448032 RepID=A0A5D5ALT7_9EURY|nr:MULTISPECIES: hypothetical protein [Natrialba]MCW8172675.1 hypothetical protein [Natrialba swarupiae]MWV39592.1 hypothetical protein [Natrialba sp. INN-245]TYT60430.1 hypothetical protein FYC77_18835 [Natrialba swarupiae]
MTSTSTNASEVGLFETRFSIAAAALSGLSVLVAVVFAWTGYQGEELLLVGTEMNIVNGLSGFMISMFVAFIALVAAAYMEPGFDH